MPSTTRAPTGVAPSAMGSSTGPRSSVPATEVASTSRAVRSCAVRPRTPCAATRPRRQRRGPGRPVDWHVSPSSRRDSPTSHGVDRIVGREPELESLERFVSDNGAWPGALVIEGTAGIGKSTLLDAAVDAARERSVEVLRCGPGEHESRLSFAALRDLLEHAYDEEAAKLPGPQRRALAVALLREEPEAPLDRGAVSAAFLTLLRERSRTGRVLLVVDDVQWLDRPTASALVFAIRRLRDEPVGLVLTHRSDGGGQDTLGLDQALSPDRCSESRWDR